MYKKRFIFLFVFALGLISAFYLTFFNTKREKVNIDKVLNEYLLQINHDSREDVFEWSFSEGDDLFVEIQTSNVSLSDSLLKYVDGRFNFEIKVLPDSAFSKSFAVVNQSVASARVADSRASGMATQLLMGMKLQILKSKGEWFLVKSPQNYICWVPMASVDVFEGERAIDYTNSPKLIVVSDQCFAYSDLGCHFVESDLVNCNVLVFIEDLGSLYKVMLPANRVAYVNKHDVQNLDHWLANNVFNADNLKSFALRFNGQPYLWGGNSFKGIDCSGLTGAVYLNQGILLPRDADQQSLEGDLVEFELDKNFENLKIGDLLFFGNERITHTGVWIGDNKFIHSSGKVHITSTDSFDAKYEKELMQRLKLVRRIDKSDNLKKTFLLNNRNIW